MSTAPDSPQQRLHEYERLFERALVRRERAPATVVLSFRADAGIREAVESLARREAACCPFLEHHVHAVGDELVWTVRGPGAADHILDGLYALTEASAQPPHGAATEAASQPGLLAS